MTTFNFFQQKTPIHNIHFEYGASVYGKTILLSNLSFRKQNFKKATFVV